MQSKYTSYSFSKSTLSRITLLHNVQAKTHMMHMPLSIVALISCPSILNVKKIIMIVEEEGPLSGQLGEKMPRYGTVLLLFGFDLQIL